MPPNVKKRNHLTFFERILFFTERGGGVVKECFEKDLDIAIGECELLYEEGVFGDLPDEVQQILVNMMFNMGRTRLSKFKKMHAAILEGDWKEAAVEGRDSRWHKQVTNRAERLMVRLENV